MFIHTHRHLPICMYIYKWVFIYKDLYICICLCISESGTLGSAVWMAAQNHRQDFLPAPRSTALVTSTSL